MSCGSMFEYIRMILFLFVYVCMHFRVCCMFMFVFECICMYVCLVGGGSEARPQSLYSSEGCPKAAPRSAFDEHRLCVERESRRSLEPPRLKRLKGAFTSVRRRRDHYYYYYRFCCFYVCYYYCIIISTIVFIVIMCYIVIYYTLYTIIIVNYVLLLLSLHISIIAPARAERPSRR